ncbi:MAG: hypothetical protein U1F77_00905 [Kiritimatiellia bacterium]
MKTGTGTMTLADSASNTYTGSTTLSGTRQLILSKTGGAVAIPGDLYMSATESARSCPPRRTTSSRPAASSASPAPRTRGSN